LGGGTSKLVLEDPLKKRGRKNRPNGPDEEKKKNILDNGCSLWKKGKRVNVKKTKKKDIV